jgi:hypothetical protein
MSKLAWKNNDKQEQLYGAFLTGTQRLFAPINDKGEIAVPIGMNGTVYILVTRDGSKVTDETIVAGPAILRFPYPSDP